ncbi:PP0621 family protein [Paracidovorax sp. MALMAid1276]|uniref:PP0621 family protein n=1 Tax=Paracidovorax sp. MALMAid1276 TaxID=3411631 RepID=UPI003B99237E
MKYLLVLVVLLVAFGIWRSRRVSGDAPRQPRAPALPQDMLACAHCGVHIPRSDALMRGQDAYCSAEHQRLGPA